MDVTYEVFLSCEMYYNCFNWQESKMHIFWKFFTMYESRHLKTWCITGNMSENIYDALHKICRRNDGIWKGIESYENNRAAMWMLLSSIFETGILKNNVLKKVFTRKFESKMQHGFRKSKKYVRFLWIFDKNTWKTNSITFHL